MTDDPYLKTWIVPKLIIKEFTSKANSCRQNLFVFSILDYDKNDYLVLTSGSYPHLEIELNTMLDQFYEKMTFINKPFSWFDKKTD